MPGEIILGECELFEAEKEQRAFVMKDEALNTGHCDALILCGGLGTRLRALIGAKQKTVAEVNGRPFLFFIIEDLVRQGVRRIVLSTGYQAADLKTALGSHDFGAEIIPSEEEEPLGTGGAIRFAIGKVESEPFFVLNGDSFCQLRYSELLAFHKEKSALLTMTVAARPDRTDYGTLWLAADGSVQGFTEKEPVRTVSVDARENTVFSSVGPHISAVYVNAGVYCFSRRIFAHMPAAKKFSLEYDLFPALCGRGLCGFVTKGKFIDIGTPSRFQEAQEFFTKAG